MNHLRIFSTYLLVGNVSSIKENLTNFLLKRHYLRLKLETTFISITKGAVGIITETYAERYPEISPKMGREALERL